MVKLYFPVIIFILVSFFLLTGISAQISSSFIIIEKGKEADSSPYIEALNKADMNNYRLLDKRVRIIFDAGVIAELLSAKELSAKGIKIQLDKFREEFPVNFQLPQFALKNGFIIALYKAKGKTSQ